MSATSPRTGLVSREMFWYHCPRGLFGAPGKSPGLGQRPRSCPQKGAQIRGLAGFELHVDDRAKPVRMDVRNDKRAHDLALARRGNDLDQLRIVGVKCEVAAGEIDNESARTTHRWFG